MIAAAHIDNWLFLLLLGIAMLFRLLAGAAKKASKGSNEDEPRSTTIPPPIPRVPADSDAERVRKFLEALGQPPGSSPPPPVSRRSSYQKPIVLPHVGPYGSPLPPLTTRPPDLPEETTQPEPIAQALRRKKSFTAKVSEGNFSVREVVTQPTEIAAIRSPAEAYAIATEAKTAIAPSETSLATLLRSPSGLRNAIILREVFGPPRSLSEPDWRM